MRDEHPQVLTIKFHIPSECTLYHPCFLFSTVPNRFKYRPNAPFAILVFFFLRFQIVSNTVRMHHLPSFFCGSKSFQIPSECTLYHPCFLFFCGSKSFKYRQNAPFTVLVLFFLRFQIVSNTVRVHPLPSLFSFFCGSKSLLKRHCFKNVVCNSKYYTSRTSDLICFGNAL